MTKRTASRLSATSLDRARSVALMWSVRVRRRRCDGPGDADPEPSALVARAIEDLRRQMPPPSAELQERILQSADRSRETWGNGRRNRPRLTLRPPVVALQRRLSARLVIAAAAATLMVLLALNVAQDSGNAIASGALRENCPRGSAIGSNTGAPGRRVLQVAGTWVGEEQESFEKVLELFERTTDVEVRYAFQTHDIASTLRKRATAHCPPDVALLPQPGLLQEFVRRRWLEPLDRKTEARAQRNYTAAWRLLAEVRGTPYGVWLKAANKSTFWYNRVLFAAANVDPPRTWPALQQAAARLRAAGIAPFAVAGASASAWTLTDWFENVYLRTAGEAKYKALARGEIEWTDRTVRKALLTLSEILGRSDWLAGGTHGAAKTAYEHSVRQVFSKRAAMVFEGDFVAGLGEQQRADTESDIGTFPFPAIEQARDAVVAGGDVAVQFKNIKNTSAAREFMHFLAGPAAAEPWAAAGGFISPNNKLDPQVYEDPITRRLAKPLIDAETLLFDLSDLQPPAFGAESGQGMWLILEQYLTDGPDSVPVTMRRLQRAASAARICERLNKGQC